MSCLQKELLNICFFFLPIFCMLQEFFSVILLVLSHPAVKLLSLPQLPISVGILYSLFAASSWCSTTSPVAVFLAASMKFPVRGQVEECRCAAGTKITALVFKILYSALQELFDPSCISPALFGISLALQIKNQQNNVVHNLIQSTSTEKILSTKGIYSIWFTLWLSKPHTYMWWCVLERCHQRTIVHDRHPHCSGPLCQSWSPSHCLSFSKCGHNEMLPVDNSELIELWTLRR